MTSNSVQKHQIILTDELLEEFENFLLQPECLEHATLDIDQARALSSNRVVVTTQRTGKLLRGILLLMKHHGAKKEIRSECSKQIHVYLDSSPNESIWLRRAKHILTYPLARYLGNTVPVEPDKVLKPTGKFLRWFRNRLFVFSRKNTHLWFSWYQTKRSALPVSHLIIEETYEKHLETLVSPDPGIANKDTVDAIMSDRTFVSVLGKVRNSLALSKPSLNFPSGSACFEQTRRSGGQYKQLCSYIDVVPYRDVVGTELLSMKYCPVLYHHDKEMFGIVVEVRMNFGYSTWETLNDYRPKDPSDRKLCCTVQGILEPMKVRVITKGESLPYYLSKSLQIGLHTALRNMDCFRLVGRPLSPTDLIDLMETSTSSDVWFSIDYSAATDSLSASLSRRILDELIKFFPVADCDMYRSVLGSHKLFYPPSDGLSRDPEFKGVQTNGQLMGSILSFPVLCLANLGLYLLVTKDHQKGWSSAKRLRSVLVNGDDMLYRAPKDLWDRHVELGKKIGLLMSIGKSYTHPVYANINSTSFHYYFASDHKQHPHQINFLNTGLFFGQHKMIERVGGSEDGTENQGNLVSTLNCVLEGCLPGKQTEILKKYLKLHSSSIKEECRYISIERGRRSLHTRNLFLPQCVGGMGVQPPLGWRFKISTSQKLLANSLIGYYYYSGVGPSPGYELNSIKQLVPVPWIRGVSSKMILEQKIDPTIQVHRTFIRNGFIPCVPNRSSYLLE